MHLKKVLSKVFRTHHYARLSLWISIIVLVCTAAFKQLFPAKQMLVFNKEVSSVLKTCWSYTCGWYTSCFFLVLFPFFFCIENLLIRLVFLVLFLFFFCTEYLLILLIWLIHGLFFSFISIFILYWKPVDPSHLVITQLVF